MADTEMASRGIKAANLLARSWRSTGDAWASVGAVVNLKGVGERRVTDAMEGAVVGLMEVDGGRKKWRNSCLACSAVA
jgi:hypothetical protein